MKKKHNGNDQTLANNSGGVCGGIPFSSDVRPSMRSIFAEMF